MRVEDLPVDPRQRLVGADGDRLLDELDVKRGEARERRGGGRLIPAAVGVQAQARAGERLADGLHAAYVVVGGLGGDLELERAEARRPRLPHLRERLLGRPVADHSVGRRRCVARLLCQQRSHG